MHIVDIFIWYVILFSTLITVISVVRARTWKSRAQVWERSHQKLLRENVELQDALANLTDEMQAEDDGKWDQLVAKGYASCIDPFGLP